MICPNCKTKNKEGAAFCENCGIQLSPDDQTTMMQDEPTIMETDGDLQEKKQPSKEKKRHRKTEHKTVEEPGKYKSAKGIITGLSALIVVMALMIGIGLWQNHSTSGDTASVTTTADSQEEDSSEDTTTAETTTEKASTTEDTASEDLPDIEAQDHVDYTNVLYLNGYETFSADGYSFGYPNAFIKLCLKTSDGYRFESDDEYEWLEYSKEKMSGSQSTASAIRFYPTESEKRLISRMISCTKKQACVSWAALRKRMRIRPFIIWRECREIISIRWKSVMNIRTRLIRQRKIRKIIM